MQGQPSQRVGRRNPQAVTVTFNEAAAFRLVDSGGDAILRNTEGDKLSMGRFQVAVLATTAPHVLDHQETHDTESVDSERAEGVAFQQVARQFDELFFAAHDRSPRKSSKSMRPTACSSTSARAVASMVRPSAAPLFSVKVRSPLLRPLDCRASATSTALASEDRARQAGL
jgi:hypothetical protein